MSEQEPRIEVNYELKIGDQVVMPTGNEGRWVFMGFEKDAAGGTIGVQCVLDRQQKTKEDQMTLVTTKIISLKEFRLLNPHFKVEGN